MNANILEVLVPALIFVAGVVAYFEMALPCPTSLPPSEAATGEWDVNREVELKL
jgi:hypothetical protein